MQYTENKKSVRTTPFYTAVLAATMLLSGEGIADVSNPTPKIYGHVPVSSNMTITAGGLVGDTVTLSYEYSDADGDVEDVGARTVKWYRDGDRITGANSISYTLVVADIGSVIYGEVRARSLTGTPTWAVYQGAEANGGAVIDPIPTLPPSVDVIANNARADGSSTDTVQATITAINGDPVQGETVTFSVTGSAQFAGASSGETDASGQVRVSLTNTKGQDVTVTATHNADAAQATVTFNAPDTTWALVSTGNVFGNNSDAHTVRVTHKWSDGSAASGISVSYKSNYRYMKTVSAPSVTDSNGQNLVYLKAGGGVYKKLYWTIAGKTTYGSNILFQPPIVTQSDAEDLCKAFHNVSSILPNRTDVEGSSSEQSFYAGQLPSSGTYRIHSSSRNPPRSLVFVNGSYSYSEVYGSSDIKPVVCRKY